MKAIRKEEILELQEQMCLEDKNFFLNMWDYLEKENPILYQILNDEVQYFKNQDKDHNGVIIYSLLQIFYLLKPLPKVTEETVQMAEQENIQWESKKEALLQEIQLFRKENPHLHQFSLKFIDKLDESAKGKVIFALMKCLRLIRIQEEINEIKST